jgi:hypothetical protein
MTNEHALASTVEKALKNPKLRFYFDLGRVRGVDEERARIREVVEDLGGIIIGRTPFVAMTDVLELLKGGDSSLYSCPRCRGIVAVNIDTGEESIIGSFRPEITDPD